MNCSVKILMTASLAAFSAQFAEAVPVVDNVDMNQATKRVDITYTLSGDAAIITLDVQTNANTSASADDPGWTSIGGAAVCNAKGDVWKKVETGSRTITWRPDQSWPDHVIADGGARAVVTAWALDNTPDYMVVDITANAQRNSQKYYPAVEYLPGGLLSNDDYRTSLIVMRKIMAKDVEWTMGSTKAEKGYDTGSNEPEKTHRVTLTNNYYIGVFELTQSQWSLFASLANRATFPGSMRPIETICYNEVRMSALSVTAASGAQEWPGQPYTGSFLDLVRMRTGLDFDLPSEAQWEFAARAGNGNGKWGDGSAITNATADLSLSALATYASNPSSLGSGTEVVGSHKPNDWGLYDAHGNVFELCLDWYKADISSLTGRVNTVAGTKRIRRGGGYSSDASVCRPARRGDAVEPNVKSQYVGFRLACQAGLQ